MWLKRRHAPCAEVPKLRDEYEKLLKETLPDVGPLHDKGNMSRPCVLSQSSVLMENSQWQEHQRALRQFQKDAATRQPGRAVPADGGRRQLASAGFVN